MRFVHVTCFYSISQGKESKQKPTEEMNSETPEVKKENSEFDRKEYLCRQNFPTTKEALAMFKDDPLCAKPGNSGLPDWAKVNTKLDKPRSFLNKVFSSFLLGE